MTIALAAGSLVRTNANSTSCRYGSFPEWLTTKLGYDRTEILTANAALSLSDIPMILAFGLLSDDIGRRKMFLTGMAVLALFAVPYFILVSTSNIWLFLLGGLDQRLRRAGPGAAAAARPTSPSSSPPTAPTAAVRWPTSSPRSSRHGATHLHRARYQDNCKRVRVAAFVIVIATVSFTCSYLMTETLRTWATN